MSGLELTSVLRQLRTELSEVMDESEGERLRFELGPVELSLTVTVSREVTPGAKIRFWVIEAGTDAAISRESAQLIKLVLSPRDMKAPPDADGRQPAPLIEGIEVPGEH
jgi:hypothetical protein